MECMVEDNNDLFQTWEKALTGLANEDEEEWEKYFTMAKDQSRLNLAPCKDQAGVGE